MSGRPVSHVAINADDIEQSMMFYREVFGWEFSEAYPGFYRMEVAHTIHVVALQQRRDLLPEEPTRGFEATVAVEDLGAVIEATSRCGGMVLGEPASIPGVGELVWLRDPGGNVVGAMKYED